MQLQVLRRVPTHRPHVPQLTGASGLAHRPHPASPRAPGQHPHECARNGWPLALTELLPVSRSHPPARKALSVTVPLHRCVNRSPERAPGLLGVTQLAFKPRADGAQASPGCTTHATGQPQGDPGLIAGSHTQEPQGVGGHMAPRRRGQGRCLQDSPREDRNLDFYVRSLIWKGGQRIHTRPEES